MQITGLILAGGAGARMGGADKGWVPWRGQPLIEHAIARLRPQVDAVAIAANRNLDRYRALGALVWPDALADAGTDAAFGASLQPAGPRAQAACHTAYAGPLAGLRVALRQAAPGQVIVVPCDAPLLPRDLVARLRAGARGGSAIAVVAGRVEPLFCCVTTDLGAALDAAYAGGERSPAVWLASIGAVPVEFADPTAFLNLNAPADLAAAADAYP